MPTTTESRYRPWSRAFLAGFDDDGVLLDVDAWEGEEERRRDSRMALSTGGLFEPTGGVEPTARRTWVAFFSRWRARIDRSITAARGSTSVYIVYRLMCMRGWGGVNEVIKVFKNEVDSFVVSTSHAIVVVVYRARPHAARVSEVHSTPISQYASLSGA